MSEKMSIAFFELKNGRGMSVGITNLGARIRTLFVPDRNGELHDVVLGFDMVDDYLPENHKSDFGAVVGRYANRLAGGRIVVDGVEYRLPQNDGQNCLHGGPSGWQYSVYDIVTASENRLELAMVSPDGDNGFPGRVEVRVVYSLGEDNSLRVDYKAVADSPTVINMTNHSYFNLNGIESITSRIDNHRVRVDADRWLEVDDTMIPTGIMSPVEGTPYDMHHGSLLGDILTSGFDPMLKARGIDHCFVLNRPGDINNCAVMAESLHTGIVMEIFTTEPGVQIYTGNFLDGVEGKYGCRYVEKSAVCFETQQFPDSPNHSWPNSTGRLSPDQPFVSSTIYKFSV